METVKEKQTETNTKTTTKITGAEAIIHCLLAEDVDLVYGYPFSLRIPWWSDYARI